MPSSSPGIPCFFRAEICAASRLRISTVWALRVVKALRTRRFSVGSVRPASGRNSLKRVISSASIRSIFARAPRERAKALICAGGSCRARGGLRHQGEASAIHSGHRSGLRSHDRSRSGATRQRNDARQASNRWRAAGAAACAVPSSPCRSMSQSGSKTGCAAPQNASKAAHARYRRHRTKARHHCERHRQNQHSMANKPERVDTVASLTLARHHPCPARVR